MTAIAEFTLGSGDFPLGRVFEEHPGARFELDRVVPMGDTVLPHFWVHDPAGEFEGVRARLDALPELRSAVLLEDLGDQALFRAEWDPEYLGVMAAIAESGVTVVAASGSRDGWAFELRAEDGDRFSSFTETCEELGVPVELVRLNQLTEADGTTCHGLTPEQREALELAYEAGYYDDPRRTDLESLATELGISRPAFSARLRRAYRNLLESTVVDGD